MPAGGGVQKWPKIDRILNFIKLLCFVAVAVVVGVDGNSIIIWCECGCGCMSAASLL